MAPSWTAHCSPRWAKYTTSDPSGLGWSSYGRFYGIRIFDTCGLTSIDEAAILAITSSAVTIAGVEGGCMVGFEPSQLCAVGVDPPVEQTAGT